MPSIARLGNKLQELAVPRTAHVTDLGPCCSLQQVLEGIAKPHTTASQHQLLLRFDGRKLL